MIPRYLLLCFAVTLFVFVRAEVIAQDVDEVFGFEAIALDVVEVAEPAVEENDDRTKNEGANKEASEKKKVKKKGDVNRAAGGAAVRAIAKLFGAGRPVIVAPGLAEQPVEAVTEIEIDGRDVQSDAELDALEKGLNAQGKQYLQQFAPAYKEYARQESRFVHVVCKLKKSEFDAIHNAARLTSRKALLKTVQIQVKMEQGWRGARPPNYPDTQQMLEEALLQAAEQALPPRKLAAYRVEIEARRKFRIESGVETIIACLDRDLMLSADQRTAIVEPLSKAWKDDWQRNIQMLVNGNNYLPRLPNGEIRKVLNNEQRAVFSTLPQQVRFYGDPWGEFRAMQGQQRKPQDDDLEFEPEDAP